LDKSGKPLKFQIFGITNKRIEMSEKLVQKTVRMSPEEWTEVKLCMKDQGIPDFSAFFHMARRGFIRRFEDEYRTKKILLYWENLMERGEGGELIPPEFRKE